MRAVMEPNWGQPAPELMELPWKSDTSPIFQHMICNEDAVLGLANDFRQEPTPEQAAAHKNAPQVYRSVMVRNTATDDTSGEQVKHAVSEGTNNTQNKDSTVSAPHMTMAQVEQGTSILYGMLDPATTISLMARELSKTEWGKQRAPEPVPDLGPLRPTMPGDPQPTVVPKPPVVVVQPFRSTRSVSSSCAGEVGSSAPESPGSAGSIGSQLLFDDADDTALVEAMAENLGMDEAAAEIDAMLQSPAADPAEWTDPDLDDLLPMED